MLTPHVLHNLGVHYRVLYLVRSHHDAHAVLDSLDRVPLFGQTVQRAVGAERVDYPTGGRITFATPRTLDRTRGIEVDAIVYADRDLYDAHRDELAPTYAGRPELAAIAA